MKKIPLFLCVLVCTSALCAQKPKTRTRKPKVITPVTKLWIEPPSIRLLDSIRGFSVPSFETSTPFSGGGANGKSSSGASGGQTLIFNDNVSKGGSAGTGAGADVGPRGGRPPGGGGDGDGQGQAFEYWYPLCLFIDESEADGNAAVKGAVDMAASCGVNLAVWPVTVKGNYPNSSGSINSMAQNACNIIEAGVAAKASVSTCVRYADTAGEMCGDPPEKRPGTAGCAQLGGGGGGGGGDDRKKMMDKMKSSGHFGGQAEDGKPVPSIERGGSCVAGIVAHESQGHSQMGLPNGSGAGNGIGMPGEEEGGGGGGGEGWTGAGCAQMRATSLKNDGKWRYNPKQKIYYIRETDPEKQWDLTDSSRKLFGGPPGGDGGRPPILAKDRINPLSQDFFMLADPKAPKESIITPQEAALGRRHRRKESLISTLLDALKNSASYTPKTVNDSSSESTGSPPPSSPSSGGAPSSGLTFNDSVSKGSTSETGSAPLSGASASSSKSWGSASSGSLKFDDNAAKGSASAGPGSGLPEGSGFSLGGPILSGGKKFSSGMDDSFFASGKVKEDENPFLQKRVRGAALKREPASIKPKK